jgi:putative intracellular protease/amidase
MRHLHAVSGICACGLALLGALAQAGAPAGTVAPLRVGVFADPGADHYCVLEALEALRIDSGLAAFPITAIDIQRGRLDDTDILLFPGGSGSGEFLSLGSGLRQMVQDFVRVKGRGVIGICAGAYLISDTPNYPCLRLLAVSAIDREHDERGSALARIAITAAGLAFLPEMTGVESGFVQFHDGPVLVPTDPASAPLYEVLATLESDIHHTGNAPAGLTPGKPFLLRQQTGRGRVFACVGHPESTPGMRWLLPRMARWVAGRDPVRYPATLVRPARVGREIMHSDAMETQMFWQLFAAAPEARIEAVRKLGAEQNRYGFRWCVGLLRDASPAVRTVAAEVLREAEYTAAIGDLQAASSVEADPGSRRAMEESVAALRAMLAASPAR